MIKTFFSFLFLIFFNFLQAQEIKGIALSQGDAVPLARITVKNNGKLLSYTFTDQNGKFKIPDANIDTLYLEVSHLKFEKKTIRLTKNERSFIEIELNPVANELPEITIEKQIPIRQKKDTLIYNPEAFKDGSERVVEDLLKKLPGITVTKEGGIFYKNKEISALMLDGDDLFQQKYKVGSKNLDVNLVEAVEAIENFNPDKILHQITRSNSVALNLKLKKGIKALSANLDLENNFFSRFNNNATGLFVSSNLKGFSTNGFSNLKRNDYLPFSFVDFASTNAVKASDLVYKGTFSNEPYGYVDFLKNNFATSNAAMFKISKNLKSTVFAKYGFEELKQNVNSKTVFNVENADIEQFYNSNTTYNPQYLSFSNYLEFYNQRDWQINALVQIDKELSDSETKVNNNGVFQQNFLKSDSFFMGSRVSATKKISENKALKLSSAFAVNESNQDFLINSEESIFNRDHISQKSTLATNYFNLKAEYHFAYKNFQIILTNTGEFKSNELKLNSELFSGGDRTLQSSTNITTGETVLRLKRFKFKFQPQLFVGELSYKNSKENKFIPLFSGHIHISPFPKHNIDFDFSQKIALPNFYQVIDLPWLSSFRSVRENQGNVGFIRIDRFSTNYSYTDTYNTFFFDTGITYEVTNRNYFDLFFIESQISTTGALLLDKESKSFNINMSVQKLLSFIKLNVRYSGNYIKFSTYNFVQDDDIRSINGVTLRNNLTLQTAFKSKLNFANELEFNRSSFGADLFSKNSINNVVNQFKTIFVGNKNLKIILNLKQFLPDTKNTTVFNFLDAEAVYTWKKYNCEIVLSGRNLLSEKKFGSVSVTDFSKSQTTYDLLERTILLGLKFQL